MRNYLRLVWLLSSSLALQQPCFGQSLPPGVYVRGWIAGGEAAPGSSASGGNGGRVEAHVGVSTDAGDGHNGDVHESRILEEGDYYFGEVFPPVLGSPTATIQLTVRGHVRIHCQKTFLISKLQTI